MEGARQSMSSTFKDWVIGTGLIGALASIAVAALPLHNRAQERAELRAEKSVELHVEEYEHYLSAQTERCKVAMSYFLDETPNTDLMPDQRRMLTNSLKSGLENCNAGGTPHRHEGDSQSKAPNYIGGGGTSAGGGSSDHY